jgi:hypothetical protein
MLVDFDLIQDSLDGGHAAVPPNIVDKGNYIYKNLINYI